MTDKKKGHQNVQKKANTREKSKNSNVAAKATSSGGKLPPIETRGAKKASDICKDKKK